MTPGVELIFVQIITLYFLGMGFAIMIGGPQMAKRYHSVSIRWTRKLIGGFILWIGALIAPSKKKSR